MKAKQVLTQEQRQSLIQQIVDGTKISEVNGTSLLTISISNGGFTRTLQYETPAYVTIDDVYSVLNATSDYGLTGLINGVHKTSIRILEIIGSRNLERFGKGKHPGSRAGQINHVGKLYYGKRASALVSTRANKENLEAMVKDLPEIVDSVGSDLVSIYKLSDEFEIMIPHVYRDTARPPYLLARVDGE